MSKSMFESFVERASKKSVNEESSFVPSIQDEYTTNIASERGDGSTVKATVYGGPADSSWTFDGTIRWKMEPEYKSFGLNGIDVSILSLEGMMVNDETDAGISVQMDGESPQLEIDSVQKPYVYIESVDINMNNSEDPSQWKIEIGLPS